MGLHGCEQLVSLLEQTFLTNGGVSRQRGKAVAPNHGRPTLGQAQPNFPFGCWVVLKSHVSKSCGMLCLKSVYYNMWAHRSSCLRLIGREGIASDC